MVSGEATHTILIVFGFTRSGLEPTMYRTRDEYAYHYTTGAVFSSMTIYSSYKRHLNFLTMSQTQYEIFVLLTWFQCIKKHDNFDEFLVNPPPLYVLFIRYIHVYCSLFILKVIGVVMVAIGVILKSALDVGFIHLNVAVETRNIAGV